jgi:hypothetical protein
MAVLQAGIRLVNAAHFHQVRSWAERVRVNSGVTIETGRVLPRDDWRAPSPDELALLTACDGDPAESLALFNIPERLYARWWALAAEGLNDDAFQEYGREVMEFLHFKQLPLPPRCTISAVVNAPGLASTKPDTCGLTVDPACPGMIAAINLSDEEAALVFLNLGAAHLAARTAAPVPLHEHAHTFLTACSDYPVIRLALQPGEGFWLSPMPIAHDGDTRGRSEVDVQLVLRGE